MKQIYLLRLKLSEKKRNSHVTSSEVADSSFTEIYDVGSFHEIYTISTCRFLWNEIEASLADVATALDWAWKIPKYAKVFYKL